MAGSAIPTKVEHRSRGVVRTDITMVTDAAGVASETVVGVGFGKLVRVLYDGGLDASAVITIRDFKSTATILTYTTGTEGTPTAFRPTADIADNAGVAITDALTAVNTNRDIFLGGKVSVSVASGGNVETGKLTLIVDETDIGFPANTLS